MIESLNEQNVIAQALENKWGYLLEGIDKGSLRLNTAILLENENQKGSALLTEAPVPALPTPGTWSGQTSNAGGFDFSAGDGTGAGGDIAPFQHYLLPLVRRVYPNLIANELVGVQPMTSPASLIFYLKYHYTGLVDPDVVATGADGVQRTHQNSANPKGATAAGTEYGNFSGNTWNIDPHYSLQTVMNEAVFDAATLAAYTDADGVIGINELVPNAANYVAAVTSGSPWAQPVIENTVAVAGGFVLAVDAGVSGVGVVTYTLQSYNTTTGVATFTGVASGGTAPIAGAVPNVTLTISPLTGAITNSSAFDLTVITYNAVAVTSVIAGSTSTVTRTYDYNMEGNRQLPEMELQVESFPVAAKTRKLRTKWTIEASQDLRAMHNIDAEQELIAVLANEVTAEIDREILNDLVVNAGIRVDYDYSNPFLVGGLGGGVVPGFTGSGSTYVPGLPSATGAIMVPGSTTFDDRNKALFYQVLEISNQIYRQSLRGAGNWLVTSPELAAKLESLLEFKPDARTDTQYNLGIIYSGTLNGQFKLYKDPLFPPNLVLVGYKGSSFMDSGYFYCPYVPLQLTPTVLDTESFNPRKGLITRYGKVMVENGARMYGVIRVLNMTAVGAANLPGANAIATSAQLSGADMATAAASSDLTATGGTIL